MKKPRKLPRDSNQLAKAIVDLSTSETPQEEPTQLPEPSKNPHAVALGKLGGAKGGKARATRLTPEQRSEIARKAAAARWNRAGKKK